MVDTLLFLLIAFPVLTALGCYFLRAAFLRKILVVGTGAVLAVSSISLAGLDIFQYSPGDMLGISIRPLIQVLDFLLLFAMLYYGFKLKSRLIQVLTGFQILFLAIFEFFVVDHSQTLPTFAMDNLSLVMVLIISIVGSLICIYALPYMDEHEKHLKLMHSRQPHFFLVLLAFLGAMNGLVLSNDITYFYFFFEVTTFCSFLLIGHDATKEAIQSATRALWMNCLGGAALVIGMMWAYSAADTLSITAMVQGGTLEGAMLFPFALICFAGMTKAAQLPFQGWLLGAMVAPTPTSALLHSSTMVKAGVYLILRFSPAFAGTFLSTMVGLAGGFTFVAAAAMAVGQSNAKRVLAYSTIANLGLIIACAGMNTPEAHAAAILLIIFHAISKGLLFCCVGTIEQDIGSRDIEDMRGLWTHSPRLAFVTVTGIMTMFLPPFGALLSKWMAVEAVADNVLLVLMIALGSAFTVVYFARWAGVTLSSRGGKPGTHFSSGILGMGPLYILAGSAVVLSLFSTVIYARLVVPFLTTAPFSPILGGLTGEVGSFAVVPVFLLLGSAFWLAAYTARKATSDKKTGPYLSGIQTGDGHSYVSTADQVVTPTFSNYYLTHILGEQRLTGWVNFIAIALLAVMLVGGAF